MVSEFFRLDKLVRHAKGIFASLKVGVLLVPSCRTGENSAMEYELV
jgi:hypothetical protein